MADTAETQLSEEQLKSLEAELEECLDSFEATNYTYMGFEDRYGFIVCYRVHAI